MALETQLATVHWSPERRRDVQATNNPVDRAGLDAMIPAVDWDVFLPVAGLGSVQNFVVNETTALRDGAALLDTQPVDAWKKYLAFHLASDYASNLPKAFDEANFDFYRRTLAGVEVQRDRWKRGVQLLDNLIGEGVGEVYVAKYFPAGLQGQDGRARRQPRRGDEPASEDACVDGRRHARGGREKARDLRSAHRLSREMARLLGLCRRTGQALRERCAMARKFEWNRQVARLDEPVDRDEWGMNPQTVNAYYNPLVNQITFPAAILQPPFFDPYADPAVNYGAIGAVIGHEIGHGYDDQGREYDESGRIRNWWTPETNERFTASIARFADQYNAFCPHRRRLRERQLHDGREHRRPRRPRDGVHGVQALAWAASEAPVIDGFTGDQRFFMAHAQVWRAIQREDALRNQMLTDPHSPAAARGSIPERNMDAWYAAFDVKEGDAQYLAPENRVRIW